MEKVQMINMIVSTISSIVINIVSNDLDLKKRSIIDDLRFRKFKKINKKWLEQFCLRNDGTVVLSDAFATYLKYHRPIEKIHEFVLQMKQADQTEDEFVKSLVKECKDYVIASNRKCDIWDEGVLKDLFQGVLTRLKNYLWKSLSFDQRLVIYTNLKANAKTNQKIDGHAEHIDYKLDTIIGLINHQDKITDSTTISQIFRVINSKLKEGDYKGVYDILPLIKGKNDDLEVGIKCCLKIMSNIDIPEINIWKDIDKIEHDEIKDDIIRKIILFNFNEKEQLKKILGKTKNSQLNSVLEDVINNDFKNFFIINICEKNHTQVHEFKYSNQYEKEDWLVRRISVIYLCNQPMPVNDEMLQQLLLDDINYIEQLYLWEKHVIGLIYCEQNVEEITGIYEKLKVNKDFYMCSCRVVQEKFYKLFLQTMIIAKPEESKDIELELPLYLKENEDVQEILMRADIYNGNVSDEQVIKHCIKLKKYFSLIYYLIETQKSAEEICSLFDKYDFIIKEDVQSFLFYIHTLMNMGNVGKARILLEKYKEQHKDYLEYWLQVLKMTRDEKCIDEIVQKWFRSELKWISIQPDEELAKLLLEFECYDEVEQLIDKIETFGKATPYVLRMKTRVLIKKGRYLDALNILMEIFDEYKTDPYVIDNIIVISLNNKRNVSEEVLNAAVAIGTSRLLQVVSSVYMRTNRETEAKKLLTKALLMVQENDSDIFGMYFGMDMRKDGAVQKITGVDVDTAIYLKNKDLDETKIFCIYADEVLPYDSYMWENAEHIYMDTAIQNGLVRKKKGDIINLANGTYSIIEIEPLEFYLRRICMNKMIDSGVMKPFTIDTREDGMSNQEKLVEWMKANTPENKNTFDWLANYKEGELPLPFYSLCRFTRMTQEQFIIAMLEEKSVSIREVFKCQELSEEKYVLSFATVIVLYKLGIPIEILASKDIIISDSLKIDLKEECEKIIDDNNREHVSSMGVHDDKLFMQVTTDEEKQKWMSEAVGIKKYSEKIKSKANMDDLILEAMELSDLKELIGVCDYDALAIAKEEKRTLVTSEIALTQLTLFRDVSTVSVSILEFLCSLNLDVLELLDYMMKMLEYRFVIVFNKIFVNIVRDAYLTAESQKQELIATAWEECLILINESDIEYKKQIIPIINETIRELDVIETENVDIILQRLGHYALIFNNIKLQISITPNFEVEVKAYKVAESIENYDSGEHVLVD